MRSILHDSNGFLDDPRGWHVNHLLIGALLDALMIDMLCMCGGFLDNWRDWHVNHPLIRVLLDVLLWKSLG